MRLGDLDALKKEFDIIASNSATGKWRFIPIQHIKQIIDNAPTVIVDNCGKCPYYKDSDRDIITEAYNDEYKTAKEDFENRKLVNSSQELVKEKSERPQGEVKNREFLDRVNISELSNEEKLKLVEQIMPDNKYDEVILAHERIAYERGVADGYAEAIEERPQGEWIYGEDDCGQDGWFCSECNFFVPWYYQYYEDIDFIRDYKVCPHCLAEMVTYTGKDRDKKGGAEE